MEKALSLFEFREYMKGLAERDAEIKYVQVSALSVEAALSQAAIELGIPVAKLEYETIVKGSAGMLGFGKKNYTLVVYKKDNVIEESSDASEFGTDEFVEENAIPDKDGDVIITLIKGEVFIKVLPAAA